MKKYRISLGPKEVQVLNNIVEKHFDAFIDERPFKVEWGPLKKKKKKADRERDEYWAVLSEISNKVLRACRRAKVSRIM